MPIKDKNSINFLTWKKVQDNKPSRPNLRGLNLGYSKDKTEINLRLWRVPDIRK